MKNRKVVPLLFTSLASALAFIGHSNNAQAVSFQEERVEQTNFIVLASLLPINQHKLTILEQLPSRQRCWNEIPTSESVNPLLLEFNFEEHCKRYDANSYSVRMSGKEAENYKLRVRHQDLYLSVEAWNPFNPNEPVLQVGRAYETTHNHVKIRLNPGWNLSRRVWDSNPLNHLYFSLETLPGTGQSQ